MSNATFTATWARIREIMEATDRSLAFAKVYGHEPRGFPAAANPAGVAYGAFWWAGESEKPMTLGNVMPHEEVQIRVYWAPRQSEEARDAVELEMRTCNRELQEAFSGDRHLRGEGNDTLAIGLAEAGYETIGGAEYRVLRFSLDLWLFEEEAVAQ